MEVGIEDCLHIEFEYNKSRYHLRDTVVGKIYFLLVSPTQVLLPSCRQRSVRMRNMQAASQASRLQFQQAAQVASLCPPTWHVGSLRHRYLAMLA